VDSDVSSSSTRESEIMITFRVGRCGLRSRDSGGGRHAGQSLTASGRLARDSMPGQTPNPGIANRMPRMVGRNGVRNNCIHQARDDRPMFVNL
jgi:hypothetical protein